MSPRILASFWMLVLTSLCIWSAAARSMRFGPSRWCPSIGYASWEVADNSYLLVEQTVAAGVVLSAAVFVMLVRKTGVFRRVEELSWLVLLVSGGLFVSAFSYWRFVAPPATYRVVDLNCITSN